MAQLEGSAAAAAVTEASSDPGKTVDTTPVLGGKGGKGSKGGKGGKGGMIKKPTFKIPTFKIPTFKKPIFKMPTVGGW